MWLALALPAAAFSPAVHRALAERAVVLEGVTMDERRFVAAVTNEDWDLPRKWTRWHHYYNPDFPVRSLWRLPSEARVAWLTTHIEAGIDVWGAAGLLAHHLQDMASPPHVVPVAHGLGDDFESYDVRDLIAAATGDPVVELPPVEAQRAAAEETLAALAEPTGCGGDWSRVWVSEPGGWGHRGEERFGRMSGCEAAEEAFARARIEDAVSWTRAVIRYAKSTGA